MEGRLAWAEPPGVDAIPELILAKGGVAARSGSPPALIFAAPEDVLSRLPNMEGKVPDTNYLGFPLAQLVQVAIGQLLGSVTAALQETAQSRVRTVKTVTRIIIKIPASLDA